MPDQTEAHVYELAPDAPLRETVIKAAYLARRAGTPFAIRVPGAGVLMPIYPSTGTIALRNHTFCLQHMRMDGRRREEERLG